MCISQKIDIVKCNMKIAAEKANKDVNDILLVAVSKTNPVEKIIEAKKCGLNVFGENKVQELIEKYPMIQDVKWHLIGHLQKNKVKYIIDKVEMIHSLDNIELAEEIQKRSQKINIIMPVLVQINIGREDSKSGIFIEDVDSFFQTLKNYPNLMVSGIMTIPPPNENPEMTRVYFKEMKKLFEHLKVYNCSNINIKYLSMGMSDDYQVAIEEGANIVRVGTSIFGKRIYNKEE